MYSPSLSLEPGGICVKPVHLCSLCAKQKRLSTVKRYCTSCARLDHCTQPPPDTTSLFRLQTPSPRSLRFCSPSVHVLASNKLGAAASRICGGRSRATEKTEDSPESLRGLYRGPWGCLNMRCSIQVAGSLQLP